MIDLLADPIADDLLARAIAHVRPRLAQGSVCDRVRTLWAAVRAASDLEAAEVIEAEFLALACESGLAADLREYPPHPHDVEATLRHVIRWAMRGMSPFSP